MENRPYCGLRVESGNLRLAMLRTIRPELLDSLPPQHPDALHNRRDLRVTNRVMGNHRWFARTLPLLVCANERLLEIGAGTGELASTLQQRRLAADALDLWPTPQDWSPAHVWHRADLRTFDRYDDYPVLIGNLILHQFTDEELSALGAQWRQSARVLAFCEPVRRRGSQFLYRVFGPLLGVNHVSLHDAHVSIAAGFSDHELPDILGLDASGWRIRISTTPLGAYRMVAVRRS